MASTELSLVTLTLPHGAKLQTLSIYPSDLELSLPSWRASPYLSQCKALVTLHYSFLSSKSIVPKRLSHIAKCSYQHEVQPCIPTDHSFCFWHWQNIPGFTVLSDTAFSVVTHNFSAPSGQHQLSQFKRKNTLVVLVSCKPQPIFQPNLTRSTDFYT